MNLTQNKPKCVTVASPGGPRAISRDVLRLPLRADYVEMALGQNSVDNNAGRATLDQFHATGQIWTCPNPAAGPNFI